MISQQHKYDIVAANLLFVGFLFGTVISLATNSSLLSSTIFSGPASWVLTIISVVVVLAHYYFIRQGYRWAKILFFIFFGFSALFLLLGFKKVVDTQFTSPLKAISFALQWLSRVVAFILLLISFKSTRRHSK